MGGGNFAPSPTPRSVLEAFSRRAQMSANHQRRFWHVQPSSGLTSIATKARTLREVRDGPKAAVSRCSKNPLPKVGLFDHLVGARDDRRRNLKADRFCSFQVNSELERHRLRNGEISGLGATQNLIGIERAHSK